jgi:hypothetical protein
MDRKPFAPEPRSAPRRRSRLESDSTCAERGLEAPTRSRRTPARVGELGRSYGDDGPRLPTQRTRAGLRRSLVAACQHATPDVERDGSRVRLFTERFSIVVPCSTNELPPTNQRIGFEPTTLEVVCTAQARTSEHGSRTRLKNVNRRLKRAEPCRMMSASWESNPRCHEQGSNLRAPDVRVPRSFTRSMTWSRSQTKKAAWSDPAAFAQNPKSRLYLPKIQAEAGGCSRQRRQRPRRPSTALAAPDAIEIHHRVHDPR